MCMSVRVFVMRVLYRIETLEIYSRSLYILYTIYTHTYIIHSHTHARTHARTHTHTDIIHTHTKFTHRHSHTHTYMCVNNIKAFATIRLISYRLEQPQLLNLRLNGGNWLICLNVSFSLS